MPKTNNKPSDRFYSDASDFEIIPPPSEIPEVKQAKDIAIPAPEKAKPLTK